MWDTKPTVVSANDEMVSAARSAYRNLRRYTRGPRLAWCQDVLRPRILETNPLRTRASVGCPVEVHTLTCADDWLNLIWAVKSFYHATGRDDPLCIHSDGSLSPQVLATLRKHFPEARLIDRRRADREVLNAIAGYPRAAAFRLQNHFAIKLLDFGHYLKAKRLVSLDSDVLFFDRPDAVIRCLEDPGRPINYANGDLDSSYTVSSGDARRLAGVELVGRLNAGFGLFHRDSLRLDWIEEFLALPGILGHWWRIEQTLYALCSSRFGCELLPPEYDVFIDGPLGDRPCRHYVGAVRHLMYTEGMRKLSAGGFLR